MLFQTISDLSPVGRLVEYWCAAAVAEELHFTRAANRLHIDQSALSRHIQKLEASLRAKLFIRGERKVELTETADAFIPFARKALAAARVGVQVAQSIARGEPQEFEIAYSTCVDSRLIARFRELVERLGFRLPVRFRSFPPDQLIGRLFIGESFAVLTQLPVLESVAQTTVLMEELFIAVRSNHYLAEKAQATLSDLGNAPVIWPAGAMPTALTVDHSTVFGKSDMCLMSYMRRRALRNPLAWRARALERPL